jgi:ABC-type transport system involved in multi-copper enzyme maturation permease subunit
MFASIFAFELRRWMRSVSTYIYFGILFILTFLLATAAGGTWDSVNVSLGIGEKVHANSPFEIDFIITFITSYIGVIFVIAIIGNSVLKDFASNTYSMIFTTSVSKFNYLFGRFTASLVVCLFICLAAVFGTMLAFAMPWINADKLGAFVPAAYWNTFILTIIPNILLMGTIFFAVSLFSRDLFIIWLSLIGFYVLLGVSSSYTNNLKHENLAALIDPMTPNLKFIFFKYWTIADKNTKLIPLEGVFLLNRIIWISFSLLLLGVSYWYFSFSISPRVTIFRRRKIKDNEATVAELSAGRIGLMSSNQVFTNRNYLKNLVGLIKNEVRTILRNTYFRIILVFGLGFLLLVSSEIGKLYDTSTYPVTYEVIGYFGGVFKLFIVVLTIMFSGELVWRNRDYRMNLIMDALPVPSWVFYLSKVISLMIIQALLLCVVIVAGVIVQTFKGYTNYEILLYVRYLFGISLLSLWLLAVLSVLIQTLVNNKYIGYFITALFYIWNSIFAIIVLKHNFFSYGSDPGIVYSDMNGFGHGLMAFYIYKLFWGALAVCLAVISSLLWARGTETRFKIRLAEARQRASRSTVVLIASSFCIFLVSGGFIYYNTNVENRFTSDYQQEQKQLAYERKYKKFEHISQPKVTAVKLNADIYPMERRLHSTGTYVLKNKSSKTIDSVHIFLPDAVSVRSMTFDRPSKLAMKDDDYNYRIYSLSKPLQPGDSTTLSFDLEIISKGFKESFQSTLDAPVYNGTFMNNRQFLPYIGYNEGNEIHDNNTRKKYGLPYKRTSTPINDSVGHYTNLFTGDADFITFEVTVSTIPGQIALAPGYLQKEWTENGRRYFHYKMDSRIANFFSILSANWEVKKEMYNGVSLEIYYHKGHEYDLDRMFNGMKKSLAYYTTSFGPYQHRQLRILEFPRYASFAQSFDNTVPYSEAIGFIAMVRPNNDGDIDYPFYITAHETAHQWWGHQIIGANVEGSNMMSESLAQYSSITLLEKEYGMEKVDKFLAYEMNNYLQSRSFEREKEKPLQYVDDGQAYILYQKGGLVFHSLQKYIGEDSLNHAMKRFITRYKFQGPPYPTTLDFVNYIRQSTPDSMQYLLSDMFTKIILYDNKLNSVSYTKAGKDYKVTAAVESTKYEDDSLGAEKAVASNDYIEVGLYDRNDKCMKLQKFKMHKGVNNISMEINKEPYKVIVDPEHLLIDKKLDDNEKTLDKPTNTLASK